MGRTEQAFLTVLLAYVALFVLAFLVVRFIRQRRGGGA